MISKNRLKYLRSLNMKKVRDAESVFIAEGTKIVPELFQCGFVCEYICCTDDYVDTVNVLLKSNFLKECPFDVVSEEELKRASFLETPQSVIAVFRKPEHSAALSEVAGRSLCLALDCVQNPGNLGTILRIADWFGVEDVFCSGGCADVYNPKTIQATMGAIGRVRVHYCNLVESLDAALKNGISVYGTFLDGDNIYKSELNTTGVIIMGNEGQGISSEVSRFVTDRILIPAFPEGRQTSESLNVAIATAIVCAEFRRKA